MADAVTVDATTGEEQRRRLSTDEEGQRQRDVDTETAAAAAERDRQAVRDRLTQLAVKVKDGTASTTERTEALNLAVRVTAGIG